MCSIIRWLTDLGGGHGKEVLLCGLVFGGVGAGALAHHQHQVLVTASERTQVLIGEGDQRLLLQTQRGKHAYHIVYS